MSTGSSRGDERSLQPPGSKRKADRELTELDRQRGKAARDAGVGISVCCGDAAAGQVVGHRVAAAGRGEGREAEPIFTQADGARGAARHPPVGGGDRRGAPQIPPVCRAGKRGPLRRSNRRPDGWGGKDFVGGRARGTGSGGDGGFLEFGDRKKNPRTGDWVKRELPFTASFSPAELAAIRGIRKAGLEDEFGSCRAWRIWRCCCRRKSGWWISRRTTSAAELPAKIKNYTPQLKLYASALARIFSGRSPIAGCIFY